MATIYDLKPRFQALLRPLNHALAGAGVSANQVTIAALALSVLGGLALALLPGERWPLLCLPVVLFLRMALNAIDGMLAREHGMATPAGALLNEIGDVLSDTALYLPFALVPGVSPLAVAAVVSLAAASELAGVAGVQIGASRRYDGPMGKSDRAFLFGLAGLLLGLGAVPPAWINALFALACLLLLLTIANRARRALEELSR